ncbi:MAG: nucleotidyltransferase domain-containing protein [Anaerolineae bacterium]|nr:nucleotidyltransferase domain-containing protein [Anaerolineae bacterium]
MVTPRSRPLDVEAVAAVLARYPGVLAAYLFGSQAAGHTHRESDIDIAVVPRDVRIRERRLDLLADLAREGFSDIDLVFLDSDDVVLKHEAIRLNRVIYQAPDFDAGAYYSLITRMYLDFLPYLEVQRAAYKRRILDGESGSHP